MKTHGSYKIKSTKLIYKNPWIRVQEDQVIMPNGKNDIFGIVNMIDGVTVILVDNENNIYLAKEFKYAVGRITIEAISGGIDKNETKEKAAKRELMEETGLKAEQWDYLGVVDPFTTIINSRNHIFLARQIIKFKESDEKLTLKVIKIPFSEAVNWVANGKITHAASCVAILKAARILNT